MLPEAGDFSERGFMREYEALDILQVSFSFFCQERHSNLIILT